MSQSCIAGSVFNLNAFNTEQCLSLFRFKPADLGRLAGLMEVSPTFTRHRHSVSPLECLAISLRRLSSPCRRVDLEELLGRSSSALSDIFYVSVEHSMEKWGPLLTTWRGDFMAERAPLYTEAIKAKGARLDMFVGFTDGTKLSVSARWPS